MGGGEGVDENMPIINPCNAIADYVLSRCASISLGFSLHEMGNEY